MHTPLDAKVNCSKASSGGCDSAWHIGISVVVDKVYTKTKTICSRGRIGQSRTIVLIWNVSSIGSLKQWASKKKIATRIGIDAAPQGSNSDSPLLLASD